MYGSTFSPKNPPTVQLHGRYLFLCEVLKPLDNLHEWVCDAGKKPEHEGVTIAAIEEKVPMQISTFLPIFSHPKLLYGALGCRLVPTNPHPE